MTDNNAPTDVTPSADDVLSGITSIPEQLPGIPQRQAVFSITGIVYQAWWSIDAWLRLSGADEVIYLEGAEDFDIVKTDSAISVQVKHNVGTISLGTVKALEALENFWTLTRADQDRQIHFHYLTTSSVAMEQDADFEQLNGIEAWRAAQTNIELSNSIAKYLESKLSKDSPLKAFMVSATPEDIQKKLIKRFHWITDQPSIEVVKQSVNDRIAVLLENQRRSISQTHSVRKYLESRFWEVILYPSSESRYLNRGDLLRQVEEATTTYLAVPTDQIPNLIGNARPGLNLLKLLLDKSPKPPAPLLQRPQLTTHLENLVKLRKVVLLTGTVFKGKTTIAQLVASTLCTDAWWINLTERQSDQVDVVLLALAGEIERGDCPNVVVIDDLDISVSARRVYHDSLQLVLHRANISGRGIILTARGGSNDSAIVQDFENIEIFEVPELSTTETENLCIEHGCASDMASTWAGLITAWTGGHPKLVQVRIAELVTRNWPAPSANDISNQSSAVTSVRQLARQLISETETPPIAEFVYMASECSVLMHRSVAIRIAESVDGLTNAGDVLDKLTGKWLERVDSEWFRSTPLLKGGALEVWSDKKRKQVHVKIHDAIQAKGTMDPFEAAALLYHAFIGNEPRRIALTATNLQLIEADDAKQEVERQLLWLPFVALEDGQSITDDAIAGSVLRSLQYRVASTLDSEYLPQICARWADDIERIENHEAKFVNQIMMWMQIGFAENKKVPLKYRFDALQGLPTVPTEMIDVDIGRKFFEIAGPNDGLPMDGTIAQAVLLAAIQSVRDLSSLEELRQWLDSVATEEIRQQFDEMLDWLLVQNMGAYVQGAWAANHEEIQKWQPWLDLFERVEDYATRRSSQRFGREAAKARATILSEYLDRSDDALIVLEQAEISFGTSVVLMEQRANVLFQEQNDESVLEIWNKLSDETGTLAYQDPFACRRAGISAARLEKWGQARQIFLDAANSLQTGYLEQTKFGLQVDAAHIASQSGNHVSATETLVDAVLTLPDEAAEEGNGGWDSVQRLAVGNCRVIESKLWKKIKDPPLLEPGCASSPMLKDNKSEPGQEARNELTRIQVLLLASTLLSDTKGFSQYIDLMSSSKYFFVRWYVIEAQLAVAYATGAGETFIERLLAFDSCLEELSIRRKQGIDLLEPDDGPKEKLPNTPERLLGLLCAGAICSGSDLHKHLNIWLEKSVQLLGKESGLTNNIQMFINGSSLPVGKLQQTIDDTSAPQCVRIGAACRVLQENLNAVATFQIQSLLTSALVSDDSYYRQEVFNLHVARCFSIHWRRQVKNSFQFNSPQTAVPRLLGTLSKLERGSSTLKNVLVSASVAVKQPLGDFMERVL